MGASSFRAGLVLGGYFGRQSAFLPGRGRGRRERRYRFAALRPRFIPTEGITRRTNPRPMQRGLQGRRAAARASQAATPPRDSHDACGQSRLRGPDRCRLQFESKTAARAERRRPQGTLLPPGAVSTCWPLLRVPVSVVPVGPTLIFGSLCSTDAPPPFEEVTPLSRLRVSKDLLPPLGAGRQGEAGECGHDYLFHTSSFCRLFLAVIRMERLRQYGARSQPLK